MPFEKLELLIVLVNVVFLDFFRQATHHKKVSLLVSDSACPIKNFLNLVTCFLTQRFSVIDIDP